MSAGPARGGRRDPEATREALLGAAVVLFSRQGYSGTSVRDLAEAAGVTKSLIHHHFGGKTGLWHAVLNEQFRDLEEAAALAIANESVAMDDLSCHMMRLMFHGFRQKPELARLLAWTYLEDVPLPPTDSASFHGGMERIAEAQRAGAIRDDVDPRNLMLVFMALHEYFHVAGNHKATLLGLDPTAPEMADRYLEDALRIFVDGTRGKDR